LSSPLEEELKGKEGERRRARIEGERRDNFRAKLLIKR